MGYVDLVGYAAAATVAGTCAMKTMIPLRVIAMASNVLFLTYGLLSNATPVWVLHLMLLPLNGYRLYQMLRLLNDVRAAARGDLSMDWLKPFMTSYHCAAGQVLFRAGDKADAMFYMVSGRFRLAEIGLDMDPGQIVGELGMVTPENRRTLTLECLEAGEMLRIGYAQVKQLCIQNPQFGYYLLRLIAERLMAFAGSTRMELDEPLPLNADPGDARADEPALRPAAALHA